MNSGLLRIVDRLRSSFWFLPGLLMVAVVLLGWGTIWLDVHTSAGRTLPVYGGGAEGARELLASLAGAIITVTGVAFSIMMVVLTLASRQFGTRVLGSLTRDTGSQVVLGVLTGTFLDCLLVLRTVRGREEGLFVPQISVTTALLLSLLSIAMVIYFIHHVSVLIQADTVISGIAAELEKTIARLNPEREARPEGEADGGDLVFTVAQSLRSPRSGYVASLNLGRAGRLAARHDLVMRIPVKMGEYCTVGQVLIELSAGVDDKAAAALLRCVVLDQRRTPALDPGASIEQIVQIALLALSPGVNDPITAVICLDHLGSALMEITRRQPERGYQKDREGRVRILRRIPEYDEIVGACLHAVRSGAASQLMVLMRMVQILERVAACAWNGEQRRVLLGHIELIRETGMRHLQPGMERDTLSAGVRHAVLQVHEEWNRQERLPAA